MNCKIVACPRKTSQAGTVFLLCFVARIVYNGATAVVFSFFRISPIFFYEKVHHVQGDVWHARTTRKPPAMKAPRKDTIYIVRFWRDLFFPKNFVWTKIHPLNIRPTKREIEDAAQDGRHFHELPGEAPIT